MWDPTHLKGESWLAHTKRAAKLSTLLLFSGLAMGLHMLIPFWQQPKFLCVEGLCETLCRYVDELEARNGVPLEARKNARINGWR